MQKTFGICLFVIAATLGSIGSAETLRIGGTGAALGPMARLGAAFQDLHPDTTIEILPSLGSGGGIKATMAGAIDIGLSSRDLKADEQVDGTSARIFAYTPLAFVTSVNTKINNVTTQELVEIYSGNMQHWPDGSMVRLVMRPASEIDTQLLRTLSEPMAEAVDVALQRPGLVSATNDQENADMLEKLEGSIGLVALGQVRAENRTLKVLTLNGEMPKHAHPFDPETEFAKALYLVTKADSTPITRSFVAFVLSEEGQKLLAALDHVPVRAE